MNVRITVVVLLMLAVASAAQEKPEKPKKPKKISTKKRVELLAKALTAMAKLQAEQHDEVMKQMRNNTNKIIDLLIKDDSCLTTPTTEAPAACPQPTTSSLGGAACDVTTVGGPWTVVQRRNAGKALFNKTWAEYQSGFGDVAGDYWVGLEAIHELCPKSRPCRAWFEISWPGEPHWSSVHRQPSGRYVAQYGRFSVAGPEDNYRLAIGHYDSTASTASDDMTGLEWYDLNGMAFTTTDADHDTRGSGNCASLYGGGGGWWYRNCHHANLNGALGAGGYRGLNWYGVTGTASATSSRIMVRVKAYPWGRWP